MALAEYHGRSGGKGLAVMCNSASVQVCLDAGDESDGWAGYRMRWWLADAIGPVLLAAFANSPRTVRGTRWVSYRQALRFGTDATRTRAPRRGGEPRADWAHYALRAKVAMIAEPAPAPWSVPAGLTMRSWLRGHGPRPVTLDDLERHLGTLVPPVRPRGYLEFRMIDQQPGDGWVVPLAVVTALLDDPIAADAAAAATEHAALAAAPAPRLAGSPPARARRSPAGRRRAGLLHGRGGRAGAARGPAQVRRAVESFIERYVARGRCPATTGDAPAARRPRRSRPAGQALGVQTVMAAGTALALSFRTALRAPPSSS